MHNTHFQRQTRFFSLVLQQPVCLTLRIAARWYSPKSIDAKWTRMYMGVVSFKAEDAVVRNGGDKDCLEVGLMGCCCCKHLLWCWREYIIDVESSEHSYLLVPSFTNSDDDVLYAYTTIPFVEGKCLCLLCDVPKLFCYLSFESYTSPWGW